MYITTFGISFPIYMFIGQLMFHANCVSLFLYRHEQFSMKSHYERNRFCVQTLANFVLKFQLIKSNSLLVHATDID